MKRMLCIGWLIFSLFQYSFIWADTSSDHDALRNLRKSATEALNNNNFSALANLLDKTFTITTVDNHKFTSLQDFKMYWDGLFKGNQASLKKIEVNPQADALTEFLSPTTGVVYGGSKDTYYFTDGDVRTMDTRWTGVVKKDADTWKLVSIHFSANLFDNPVLAAANQRAHWYGIIGLIVGFILAWLIGWFFRSRRVSA